MAVTCGRLLDQRPDLLPSRRQLPTSSTNERPPTAQAGPGGRSLPLQAWPVGRSSCSLDQLPDVLDWSALLSSGTR
ncbi:hypothetical protein [Streptomyces olivochromogenes]|uniref:hypothetical protein n=1 Tax=Streptomyces olivochromogenes TaxID=1963 RepID=UPI00074AA994|nr:hypothetical protein [Streptomyces olivochromogenes]KUN48133.1 hypothetical protein AQJ27_08830 [Streptomyces olivochromogenes]